MTVVKSTCLNCGTMLAGFLVLEPARGVRRRWQLMAVNVC